MKIRIISVLVSISLLLVFSLGCTHRPSEEELGKLNEARAAAEAAEKKLSDLRAERVQLEATLEAKKEELLKAQAERDSIKAKLGN